jgi:cytochrome c-type biogenesis protein CcmH/NrfF
MLWLLPLACAVVGLAGLTVIARRLRRELEPTAVLIDRFGREHRVAVTDAIQRVRTRSTSLRQRLSDD